MRALAGFVRRQWLARPLAVSAACFLTGVLIAQRCEIALGAWLVCAAALAALYGLILRKSGRRWFLLAMAAAVMLGGARMQLAYQMNPQVPERFSIAFEGNVVSEPSLNADGDRIVCAFRVDEMDGAPVRHTVRLYLRSDILPLEGIEYGQRLSCFGHIWPQDAATNPYEFDAREWLLSDGMTGMAAAKLEDVEVVSCDPGLGGWMIAARRAISERIGELFPDNAELVRAFVLGDRTGMDSELTERFSQTGITHLICISGMHISVLAAAVSALLNRIVPRQGGGGGHARRDRRLRLSDRLSGVADPRDGHVRELQPRAGARPAVRPGDAARPRRCWAMLAVNPLFVLDGGFALSFQASAGILLLAPPLERLFGVDRLRQNQAARGPDGQPRAARGEVLSAAAVLDAGRAAGDAADDHRVLRLPATHRHTGQPAGDPAFDVRLPDRADRIGAFGGLDAACAARRSGRESAVFDARGGRQLVFRAAAGSHSRAALSRLAHGRALCADDRRFGDEPRLPTHPPVSAGRAGRVDRRFHSVRPRSDGGFSGGLSRRGAGRRRRRAHGGSRLSVRRGRPLFAGGGLRDGLLPRRGRGVSLASALRSRRRAGGADRGDAARRRSTCPRAGSRPTASDTVQAGISTWPGSLGHSRSSSCPPGTRDQRCPPIAVARVCAPDGRVRLRSTTCRWSSRWRIADASVLFTGDLSAEGRAGSPLPDVDVLKVRRTTVRRRRAASGCWRR